MQIRLPFLVGSLLLLGLVGCPDPSAIADGSAPIGGKGGDPNGPPEGGPPGAPGGGGRPEVPGFKVEPGKGVTLSGSVAYAGAKTGTIRIDFLKTAGGGSFPELVHSLTIEAPGPWSVEAPAGLGDVSIVSFIDANSDGPSDGEPAGMIEKTTVGSASIDKLDITLSDTPDLGSLKPPSRDGTKGGPPPGGAGAGGPPGGAGAAGPPGAQGEGAPPAPPPTDGAPASPPK